MGQLSAKPILSGLARHKIFIVSTIAFGVILIVTLFGTVYESDKISTADSTEQIYNDSANQSADSILNSVGQKIARENSLQLSQSNQLTIGTGQSSAPIASAVKPQVQGETLVPPINDASIEQYKNQEIQIENQSKLKQLQNIKSAYSSKTLLYTNTPDKANASATAINLDSNVPNPLRQQISYQGDKQQGDVSANSNSSDDLPSLDKTNAQDSDQNNQKEKQNFATGSANKMVNGQTSQYLNAKITDLTSPYVLSAGSVLPSTMISGLNSDLPGQIVGMVRENIYDSPTHRILLIPQGAKLIGLYDSKITYGQERILVAWNRLIYPDGSSINLKAMPGTDIEGYAGFYDEVDNHYWKIFGSSFIMGVITAAMQYSQNNTNANVQAGGIGFTNPDPSVAQTLSGSLGQQLGQTGLAITQKNINIQPTLMVKPGYPFNVMITADMILRPYKKGK